VSPLHLVLRVLHDSQARGTLRLNRGVFPGVWRGIATFAFGATTPSPSSSSGVDLLALASREDEAPHIGGRLGVAGALWGLDCFDGPSFCDLEPSPGGL
jgi:hypothetical protein